MSAELQKRVVLSKFWIGDTVYHRADGSRGFVLKVSFETDRVNPYYFVVYANRTGEWDSEMELSDEPTFGNPTPPQPPPTIPSP